MQESASMTQEMIPTTITDLSLQRYCHLWNTRSSSVDFDPSMTSSDSLGCLATVASLEGQGHFSTQSTDGGSLDILAAAALIAGVPTDTSDSVCPILTEDGPRGVKRKREDEDEVVSLDDDLYLSDDDDSDNDDNSDNDDDDYDGDDDDSEDESDDDVSIGLNRNSRPVEAREVEFTDEFIGKEAFQVFQFGTDYDSSSESSATSDDSDDDSDDDDDDDDSGDDNTEKSDEEPDCPEACACRSGSYVQLPPLSRRYKLITPLYKKLLKYRLLRNANRFLYDCCEDRCLRRWRRLPMYRVTCDYHHDDLRVYNFRWGTWTPDDEWDEIFW